MNKAGRPRWTPLYARQRQGAFGRGGPQRGNGERGLRFPRAVGDTCHVPDATYSRCEVCGREASAWALTMCPMCAKVVCRKCGYFEFGRTFCSRDCAILFFHGDDEDELGREEV